MGKSCVCVAETRRKNQDSGDERQITKCFGKDAGIGVKDLNPLFLKARWIQMWSSDVLT